MHKRALVKPQRRNLCTFSFKPRTATLRLRASCDLCAVAVRGVPYDRSAVDFGIRIRRAKGRCVARRALICSSSSRSRVALWHARAPGCLARRSRIFFRKFLLGNY
jgi:hypothetical protein